MSFRFCSNLLSDDVWKITMQAPSGRFVTVSVLAERSLFLDLKVFQGAVSVLKTLGSWGRGPR